MLPPGKKSPPKANRPSLQTSGECGLNGALPLHLFPIMYFLPLALISLAVAGGLLFPEELDQFWFVPFLLSALYLGLPHGAADWGILRSAVRENGWRRSSLLITGYGILLVGAGTVTLAFPMLGLVVFLAVSAWHFGSADALDFAKQFGQASDPKTLALSSLTRGVLIVAAPFAFRIDDMFSACQLWCGILGSSFLPGEMTSTLESGARFVIFYALMAVAGQVLRAGALGSWRTGLCQLLEVALLIFLFAVLHPLFALGIYFLCWHSVRHLSHLRSFQSGSDRPGWLYRLAGPFLIPSLVTIGIFAFLTGNLLSPSDLTLVLIIFFAIVTPAHQWLIHREVHSV